MVRVDPSFAESLGYAEDSPEWGDVAKGARRAISKRYYVYGKGEYEATILLGKDWDVLGYRLSRLELHGSQLIIPVKVGRFPRDAHAMLKRDLQAMSVQGEAPQEAMLPRL